MRTASSFALMPATCFPELAEAASPAAGKSNEAQADPAQPASAQWMKDLVIYEVATKGFTSPIGPASGTFASLRMKLPYLHELGISGVWLSGYSVCDPHHFYNIWTQYAVIEPDKLDPSLGRPDEFKDLIETAHRLGIKIFLDVITHGLMKDSPVVIAHPAWFCGESWDMADFDWDGGHTDLDDWWVKIYSGYVTGYGIDGYRLDLGIYRPDLWERIRRNAAAAGHPIVIWEEGNAVIRGVTDFTQRENLISTDQTRDDAIDATLAISSSKMFRCTNPEPFLSCGMSSWPYFKARDRRANDRRACEVAIPDIVRVCDGTFATDFHAGVFRQVFHKPKCPISNMFSDRSESASVYSFVRGQGRTSVRGYWGFHIRSGRKYETRSILLTIE